MSLGMIHIIALVIVVVDAERAPSVSSIDLIFHMFICKALYPQVADLRDFLLDISGPLAGDLKLTLG